MGLLKDVAQCHPVAFTLELTRYRYPPLEDFEHYDHGKDADPALSSLLKGARVEDITGTVGAEVHDMQLSKLDKKGMDELALFVAQKKVVGQSIPARFTSTYRSHTQPSATRTSVT